MTVPCPQQLGSVSAAGLSFALGLVGCVTLFGYAAAYENDHHLAAKLLLGGTITLGVGGVLVGLLGLARSRWRARDGLVFSFVVTGNGALALVALVWLVL